MKRTAGMLLPLMLVWAGLAASAAVHAAVAPSFSLSVADNDPKHELMTVTLKGENIDDLYAYEARFAFDPDRMELVGAKSNLDGFSVAPSIQNKELVIAHTKVGDVKGDSGTVTIETLTIKPKKPGSSPVQLLAVKTVKSSMNERLIETNQTVRLVKLFADLRNHWSKDDVMWMVDRQIVDGMDDEHFSPDTNVTRAQFAKLLVAALKLENKAAKLPFADVADGAWYADTVRQAYAAGIVEGMTDTAFAPESAITREQMAAMLLRAKDYAAGHKQPVAGLESVPELRDEAEVSDWAKPFVRQTMAAKLMIGRADGVFAPLSQATRAEAAVVVKRLLTGMGME